MKTNGPIATTISLRALSSSLAGCVAGVALATSLLACGSSGGLPDTGDDAGNTGMTGSDSGSGTHTGDGGGNGNGTDSGGSTQTDSGGSTQTDSGGSSQTDAGGSSQTDAALPVVNDAGIDADWVTDPASHVNTLIGTTSGGNMFPGPDVPFGMIQWSPDTSPDRSQGGGYEYKDTATSGFSLTHLSGPGCGALGDIPILPMVGALPSGDPGVHTEPLTHTGEVATAGYYSVMTGATPIQTELTATKRSAMARFTYPASTQAAILIRMLGSENGTAAATATIVSNTEVSGSATSGYFCGATDQYVVYFDIIFDQPFTASQIVNEGSSTTPNVVFLTFNTTTTQVVQAKVAISFVSVANAKANWTADNPNWDFDTTKQAAHDAWNALLGKVQIAGGSSGEQELFYTSLYHALLHPNVFSDSNGQYMGFDNQVHSVTGAQQAQYANYSSWDIYHGQAQLSALLDPQEMSDSAQSMLNDAAQNSGMLPKWALENGESYVMVGDPADGILSGYYAFGATNFDTKTALSVTLNEAMVPNNIRPALQQYMELGYIPDDQSYGCCNFYGSVATVLEYGEADFALSQFAAAMGDTVNAGKLLARSQNWQNVYDPSVNMFNPRLTDGTFVSGLGLTSTQGMVEGTASQYRWINTYDREAQLTVMGGTSVVNPALEPFLANPNDFDGVGALLSNEFEIGSQYWPNYTGEPWVTQASVNQLRTVIYTDTPAYIDNNDDLGALSSQLVWSMLGIFPDRPGLAQLAINGPLFSAELIHLASGNVIAITGEGAADGSPYIQSLNLDGQPSTATWLDASAVQNGARLDFTMGSTANKSWGTGAADAPWSYGQSATSAIGFLTQGGPGPIVVPPSATTQLTLGAQSARSDVSQTVSWTATPVSGITLSASTGQLSLAPSAQATEPFSVTAPSADGSYLIKFALTSSISGVTTPSFAVPIVVAPLGSIPPYFNNAGISTDGAGNANFDGAGYSYSAAALAAAGAGQNQTVTADGFSFKWPNTAADAMDNIDCGGQTITFPSAAHAKIGFLGSATNAGSSGATGTVTVTYADKSTQAIDIVFTDWTEGGGTFGPATGDVVAVTTPYRNAGANKDQTSTYVFAYSATLTSTQPVVSVTLPATTTGGDIHLFDIELP